MFEFMDGSYIVTTILLLIVIPYFISGTEIKRKALALGIIIPLVIIIPLIAAHSSKSDAQDNIQHFKTGASFTCRAKDNNNYRVNLSDGWSSDGFYFVKDSLLIRADKCKRRKNG